MSEQKLSQELIDMLNKALEDEHQAYVQYLSHVEAIGGLNSEPIIARIKEIADDEKKHAEMFRELIGSYLSAVPSTGISKTTVAGSIEEILKVNLAAEKEAVDFYSKIMEKIKAERRVFQLIFFIKFGILYS